MLTGSTEAAFPGKRVLITGGLGFIGSNLARVLASLGAEVCAYDNLAPDLGGNRFNLDGMEDRIQVVIADVQDQARIAPLLDGTDFLFNLAGHGSHLGSMLDPLADLEANTRSSLVLLEQCRRMNPQVRIVFASTRQVYGRPQSLPVDELHPIAPLDYNGVSKLAASMYHLVAFQALGLQTTVLRLTNVYGPRMRVRDANLSFLGWWFHELIDGREIEVFGDGRQVRDFNYVDDVVEALLLCAANPLAVGQVYNLGSDESISLVGLAGELVALNGQGSFRLVEFPSDRLMIDIGDYTGDYSKINLQLNWSPHTPLLDGLARTLAFFRKYRHEYW